MLIIFSWPGSFWAAYKLAFHSSTAEFFGYTNRTHSCHVRRVDWPLHVLGTVKMSVSMKSDSMLVLAFSNGFLCWDLYNHPRIQLHQKNHSFPWCQMFHWLKKLWVKDEKEETKQGGFSFLCWGVRDGEFDTKMGFNNGPGISIAPS